MYPRNHKLKDFANILSKNMTPEEKHLWYDFFKKLPIGVKRQYRIENYIVDFYVPKKKIVIEIDGAQHGLPDNRKSDAERDATLLTWGIRVLRYRNEDIHENFSAVAADIMKYLELNY